MNPLTLFAQISTQNQGDSINISQSLIQGGSFGLIILCVLAAFFLTVKSFLHIAPPSEVLIFSGLKRKADDGTLRSFRIVIGGRGFRIPFFEKVDRMSLQLMEIPITIRGAYSEGGIALNVEAIANIKISSDDKVLPNAIERFLGRDVAEIRRVAKETLEGHLRGVLATLTPEEVNEDRLAFAKALSNESEEDLKKLGLHVDTVKIQHVTDDVNYLSSLGRSAIASVIRDAEIAESNFKRAAEQAVSENMGRANVAVAQVDANVIKMKNGLRTIQADLDSQVHAEEERTEAAAREARATAEQELQRIRAELSVIQQMVDTILPAEANRMAEEYKARGQASILRERGRATSESLNALQEAWHEAGENATQIALIEDLEKVLSAAVNGIKQIKVANIEVIDNGEGRALSNYSNTYSEMLKTVFKTVQDTVGIDIPGALQGNPKAKSTEVKK